MKSSETLDAETLLIASLQEYKNPLVIFCLGILIGSTFYFKEIGLPDLFVLCAFVSLLLIKNKKLYLMLISVIVGYFYCILYFKYFITNLDNRLNKNAIFAGEILSNTDENDTFNKKYYFKIRNIISDNDSSKEINSKIQVVGSHYEEYDIGDIVQVTGKLTKPKSAILPGLFDEKRYLLSKGVHYILKAEPGTLLFLDSPAAGFYKRKINEIRNKLTAINEKYLAPDQLAIINGIVFGSKASKLPDFLKDKIQNLGLSHITSASGFNVSILAAGIFYIFRLFTRNSLLPTVISMLAVLLYSSLADFSASIIRAAIFIIMILVGNVFNKKLKILPGLSLIILMFFYFNPVNILDVGLQLSILAFLGLALFLGKSQNQTFLFSVFLQSLFAQIMVIPLIVFYFHNIQLLGLISNIIAVPIASLILIVGLLDSLIVFIPRVETINAYLCLIQKVLSTAFLSWINLLDKISLKQIYLPNLNFYFLILIYALIMFCLCSLFVKTVRQKYKSALALLFVLFLLTYIFTDASKYLKIFCLAKYNNDSVLVIPPKEKPIFISSRLDYIVHRSLVDFLRLNNLSSDYNFYYLNEKNNHLSSYIKDNDNKTSVAYDKFSFEILKNYKSKVSSTANYLKLPILMKSDPELMTVLEKYGENLIINDYKKLSKESFKDVLWIKKLPIMSYFLSNTGTITLITDGKNHKIDLANY